MKKSAFYLLLMLLPYLAWPQLAPALETYTLKNGLKIYFLKYGKIEAMHISLIINSGKKNETPGQQGYNGLTAGLVLKGNKKYTAEQQNDKAYAIGAELKAAADFDKTTISCDLLSKDADTGFDLLSAAVLSPLFEKDKVTQNLSYMMDYNNPAKMDIARIAAIYSNLSVYGIDSPLGRSVYKSQIKQITPEKIREFYLFNYTPKNTKIIVCGNFDNAQIKALIETYFGGWQSAYGEVNGVALDLPAIKKQETGFVNRAGASQCALQWNKLGPSVKDKDYVAYTVANMIFNEVLFKEIREKGGKTYGIYCTHRPSKFSNTMAIACSVRSSEMLNTVNLFDKTLLDFSAATFSQSDFEIQTTKFKTDLLLMEFPEQISNFYDPVTYDFNTRKNILNDINNLKMEDVQKVVKKYYTADSYKLVIAGDESLVGAQLEKLKSVKKYTPSDIELKN